MCYVCSNLLLLILYTVAAGSMNSKIMMDIALKLFSLLSLFMVILVMLLKKKKYRYKNVKMNEANPFVLECCVPTEFNHQT